MPHYVYDDTALLFPKTNLNPLPPGGDPTKYVQSVDWNTANQAIDDIKTMLRGAQWYGVEKQATDPGPAGVADYLWADIGGSLYFHTGGGDVLLTPAAATVTGAANIGAGVGSIGVYKQLSGGNLELKGVRPASSKLSAVDAIGTDDIDLDVVEANIVHQNLSGAGTNDHAVIDAQLPSTSQKTDLGQLDGAAQGTIWYSSAVGRVTRLAPGTDKQFLRTNGAGADPSWANALVSIQDTGLDVANTPHATLNFTGAGVSVVDGGGGVATISIVGVPTGLDESYSISRVVDVDLGPIVLTDSTASSGNVLEVHKTPGVAAGGSALVASVDAFCTSWVATFDHPGIGNVGAPTKGIQLRNTTPATASSGNEEFSPVLSLVGSAHDNTSPRTWSWAFQNQTVNVTGADESHLHFLVDDNGGGFNSVASIDQVGELTLGAGLVLGAGAVIGSAGAISFSATDLDLQASVTTLDLKGGTSLSIDGTPLTTGLTAALLSEALLFFTNTGLTGAEAETLSDGSNADALHTHALLTHTIASHSDTTATGAELETLTDGSNADTLHSHATLAATSTNISIVTTTSGDVDITAAGNVDITGAALGFFSAVAVAQQASGANLTNNVTAGGTSDIIDNFTDLTTYATDAAAIRNAIYQLARKLKQVNDGMRAYGLLT